MANTRGPTFVTQILPCPAAAGGGVWLSRQIPDTSAAAWLRRLVGQGPAAARAGGDGVAVSFVHVDDAMAPVTDERPSDGWHAAGLAAVSPVDGRSFVHIECAAVVGSVQRRPSSPRARCSATASTSSAQRRGAPRRLPTQWRVWRPGSVVAR